MRFAIDVSSENPFRPSGATGYYVSVAREIAKIADSDEIFLVRGRNQEATFRGVSSSTQSIVLPYSNEKPLLRVAGQQFLMPALLRKNGIDLLNTGNVGPVFPGTPMVATVKTMHAFTAPESLPASKRFFRKYIGGRTASQARLIISNSESNNADLVRYFSIDPARIRIVHEALDHDLFKPESPQDGTEEVICELDIEKSFVLFVSSLWRYKNAETLIRSIKEVSRELPDVRCLIVGYQPDLTYFDELTRLVTELGLEETVVFAGGMDQRSIAALYRRALVLVYPSRNETFGLPLLEAMACGCPVITTTAGSLPEIGGDSALYFDPDDVEQLASLISTICTDSNLIEKMRQNGLDRAAKFTWANTARQTLEVFREALSD